MSVVVHFPEQCNVWSISEILGVALKLDRALLDWLSRKLFFFSRVCLEDVNDMKVSGTCISGQFVSSVLGISGPNIGCMQRL